MYVQKYSSRKTKGKNFNDKKKIKDLQVRN